MMLSDRVLIVIGGGRGLGEATATALAEQGARVVVSDLGTDLEGQDENDEPAQETVDAIESAGGTAMAHYGDITSLEYTDRLIEDTVERYGRVDGAVNFAGIIRDSILHKMRENEWDDVIRVHLRGHFALLRNLAQHWRSNVTDDSGERSFLSISSRAALGNAGQANYSAAKAGVLGFTRTSARELHRYDVRVNALMPTAFTRMIEEIPEDKRPFEQDEIPPEKVTPMIVYLMSEEATGINGCTFRAAGDEIGIVSDPEIYRLGFNDGGWSPERIAAKFRDTVADGVRLNRAEES